MKQSMKRSTLWVFLFFFLSFSVFSESPAGAEKKAASGEGKSSGEEEGAAALESLAKERRDILKYGIDSEIVDVINAIRSEKDDSCNEELKFLLETNKNPEINRAVLEFMREQETDLVKDRAMEILEQYLEDYDYNTNLLLSVVSYLSSLEVSEAGPLFYTLLRDNNPVLAGSALRGIGKLKDLSRVEEIQALVEEYQGDESYEDFVANAILVMGDLKYKEAEPWLMDVLDDVDSPSSHRQYAAISLGHIGSPDGFALLKQMYSSSENSQLRSYVLKGISFYDSEEVAPILLDALRDSFWKIRVAAAEGLAERQYRQAIDILEYKVKKDPQRQVRYGALDALAKMEDREAEDFIVEQFSGERNPFDIRQKALQLMMEGRFSGSIEALKEVLGPKWDKKKDKELSPFCKILSTTQWDSLEPFYAQMIANKDFIIRIYGIRGIKINHLTGLKAAVQAMDNKKEAVNVRKEAKAALEEL